jgi:hypothetical protein
VLTGRLERYVRARFPASEIGVILRAMDLWRISYEEVPPGERLQAAVLLLADGRAEDLALGFRIAEQDWRDLLMAAGLEHGNWGDVLDSRINAAES